MPICLHERAENAESCNLRVRRTCGREDGAGANPGTTGAASAERRHGRRQAEQRRGSSHASAIEREQWQALSLGAKPNGYKPGERAGNRGCAVDTDWRRSPPTPPATPACIATMSFPPQRRRRNTPRSMTGNCRSADAWQGKGVPPAGGTMTIGMGSGLRE